MNLLGSCVGVYVDAHAVTVMCVEGGATVWSESVLLPAGSQRGDYTGIAVTLGSILDRIPKRRWPATRVETAVAAPWARVKVLHGVPTIARHRELVAMLRLNTTRFVAASRPITISGAVTTSGGDVRVGIVDRGVVDAVTRAIADRKFRLGRIVPAMSLESDSISLDSRHDTDAVRDGAGRESIASLVATARGSMKLGLAARDNPAATLRDVSSTRLGAAVLALAGAVLVYFGGQLNGDRISLTRDRAAIDSIATVSDSGVHEQAYLTRLGADLARAADFSRRRVATSLLIGEITRALPLEAAITTLRIDTSNVDIVVLSPRTAAVVDAVSDLPDVESPAIIGPVSRETVGPKEFERATIRLRISPDYNRDKTAFEVARENDR